MSDGIYVALSGAIAQQRALDVVANNVANSATAGFRGDRVAFREQLARASSSPQPNSIRFSSATGAAFDNTSGSLRQTGNALDLALAGDGWFVVRTPRGDRYTRSGSFMLDGQGILKTHQGHAVLGTSLEPSSRESKTVQIPPNAGHVVVEQDGTIRADDRIVGRLKIVTFEGSRVLSKEGDSLFTAGAKPILVEAGDTQVNQGYIELSNVNPIAGMNELITVTRSFEAFQKVIETFQKLDERTARDVGSPGRG